MHKLRNSSCIAVAALLAAACGGGHDDASWLFPLWVETDVKVVDIDGDGRRDVVTLAMVSTSMSHDEGVLTIRRQSAPGVYSAPQAYPVGTYPWTMAVGDIDGDDAPDLVVGDAGSGTGANKVWLVRQDGANRGALLAPQLLLETADMVSTVGIGDLNGDGAPDVLVAAAPLSGGKGVTLLLQDAGRRGAFAAPMIAGLPGYATAGAAGDLNGDGRNDIVARYIVSTTNYVSTTALAVTYQQPGGTFGPWTDLPSVQTGINTGLLAITDLNGDGALDIVEYFTPSGTDFRARATTLLQDPVSHGFARRDTSLAGLKGIDGAVVADLDADGLPDLATVGFYPDSPGEVDSTLNVLRNDGAGGFVPSLSTHSPVPAGRLAAGDLDGDGRNDIVLFGSWNHQTQLFRLIQSASAPGTFLAPVYFD